MFVAEVNLKPRHRVESDSASAVPLNPPDRKTLETRCMLERPESFDRERLVQIKVSGMVEYDLLERGRIKGMLKYGEKVQVRGTRQAYLESLDTANDGRIEAQ